MQAGRKDRDTSMNMKIWKEKRMRVQNQSCMIADTKMCIQSLDLSLNMKGMRNSDPDH